MSFAGRGFVVVQPCEELPASAVAGTGGGNAGGQNDGLGGVIGGFLGGGR